MGAGIQSVPTTPCVRLATISDSINKHNNEASQNTYMATNARGEVQWAKFFNPRINYYSIYDDNYFTAAYNSRGFRGMNNGISGDVSDGGTYGGVYTRLLAGDAISTRPDVIYLEVGTNDITVNGTAVETIYANIERSVELIRALGIPVIVATVSPRPTSVWAVGSTNRQAQKWLNQAIRNRLSRRSGVIIFDRARIIADMSSSTGAPQTGYLDPDGLHNANIGAYYLGKQLAALISTLFPGPDRKMFVEQDDTYDATLNPYGNIAPPTSSGTAGGKANGVTGSVMTGWKMQRSSGSGVVTVVGSVIPDTAGGYLQQWDFTLPGGGSNEVFQLFTNATLNATVAGGTWVQARNYIKLPSATALVQAHDLDVRNATTSGFTTYAFRNYDTTQLMPNDVYSGWVETDPILVPASPGAWTLQQIVRVNGASTGSFTIVTGVPILVPIDDPTGAYPIWDGTR